MTIICNGYKTCANNRQSQIKATVKVNKEMLRFYYELGRDIFAKKVEARWGSKFFASLICDLVALDFGVTFAT